MEWPGGGRPQRRRLAAAERDEGARLEPERKRLVVEADGTDVGGRMMEDVESDCTKLDVEVAAVTVDARAVDALEILEAVLGGRTVEIVRLEADLLSRLVDAVEADRISFDKDVAEVTVEARMTEALEVLEAKAGWCEGNLLDGVEDAELGASYLTETLRLMVLPRAMVAEEECRLFVGEEYLPAWVRFPAEVSD